MPVGINAGPARPTEDHREHQQAHLWNIDDTAKGQLKQSGSIVVNSTGKQVTGGAAVTPSDFYPYTLDEAADVLALVEKYSGPQADIGV